MTESPPTRDGWFALLTESDRAALYSRGTARRYRKGSTLFHDGDLSDWVLVMTSGRIKVSVSTEDGKEVVLAIRQAEDLIGDLSALDGGPRSATVTALEPVSARVVQGDDFRAFLAERPAVALALTRSICARLRDADRRRVEFLAFDSGARVAARVLAMAADYGVPEADGTRISLSISQDELAGWTGSSREAVSKALQQFRRRGWISTGRRTITVLDIEGLRSRML